MKFGMLCNNACTKQRFDLQKSLGLTLNRTLSRLRLTSGATVRDCVRSGSGHFEHMLWNNCLFVLCGSSEHFVKLLMQFCAFYGYFVVKSWICLHMHFRCFKFNKVVSEHKSGQVGEIHTITRAVFFLNSTVETALKSVNIWRSYRQN